MGTETLTDVPTLRRNGKPPSCEPCRKSKYSCDHTTPVCERCQRRGIASKCLYHPAPMRGLTPKASKHGSKRIRSTSTQEREDKGPPSIDSTTTLSTVHAPATHEPGYIGSTGYNAVLTEHGLESQDNNEVGMQIIPTTRPRRLQEAAAVLDLLADFPQLRELIGRWSLYDRLMSIIGYFAKDMADAIGRDLYAKEVWKSEESLVQAAELLFTNTDRRISVPKDYRMANYYLLFTGDNIRWEALCLFFTACGFCCNCLRADEPMFDFLGRTDDDRQDFMYKLLQASNACISFCEDAGQLSELALWTLIENAIYNTQVLGDAHYLSWRKVGDLSTAIFAQGYHQKGKDSANVPFWLDEMRKKALGSAYSIDKLMCTFVGRPPRISQRYCTLQTPLDLEYDELALEGVALEKALAAIDENGWNTNTRNRKSAYCRCFVLCARLREDVLELSLGPPQDNMFDKAMDIIRRNQALMESLPEYIGFRPGTWNRDAIVSFLAAQEYLDILYNEFMVRRTVVRQLRVDPTELLNVAYHILSATLEASTRRVAQATHAACVPWMAVLYGLPAAGVLALELLQPLTRYSTAQVSFTRPQAIQDLTVFTSSLKWVHAPCEGNYQIVEQARKTLQHLLDRILSGPLPSSSQDKIYHRVAALPSPNDSTSMGVSDSDNQWDLSWLDNAQFDADFWMNLPDHLLLS